ncbi:MAG: hypothetical protein ACLFQB_10275 [Chitinispirillaceae bacterium]
MRAVLFCFLPFLFLSGCGIFDLKVAEPPVNVYGDDPLNLGNILSFNTEIDDNVDYAELFTKDVVFEYSSAMTQIQGRDEVLKMLEYLRLQASSVDWQMDKGDRKPEGNLLIYENVPYFVYFEGEMICSGNADFHIVKNLEWRIKYWKDVPDDAHTPFFIP